MRMHLEIDLVQLVGEEALIPPVQPNCEQCPWTHGRNSICTYMFSVYCSRHQDGVCSSSSRSGTAVPAPAHVQQQPGTLYETTSPYILHDPVADCLLLNAAGLIASDQRLQYAACLVLVFRALSICTVAYGGSTTAPQHNVHHTQLKHISCCNVLFAVTYITMFCWDGQAP
jgi:hypothetical protein